MDFIVVGYYTLNSIYEKSARILSQSLNKYRVLYYLEGIECLGSWSANTAYKPTFLLRMLKTFKDLNVVYVDCDAEFLAYPKLFACVEGDVAVHLFDRARNYPRNQRAKGSEVLSGTIFFRNNETIKGLVENWERECQKNPKVWDQKSLEKVLDGKFTELPGEYCKIFDRMRWIKDPVIVHYQNSRIVRRMKGRKGSLKLV